MKKESNMNNKEWRIPFQRPEIPRALIDAGYNPLLAAVLAIRGITTADSADAMIKGGSDCVYDPMLILGMDKAAERVRRAIETNEPVAVYGDYDVDGITSTCLVTDYLRSKGLKCRSYIPDRNEEGYGLNCAALDALKADNISLIITVDCGITAVEEAEYARKLGIDMVITDHHECKSGELPNAVAVVDCRRNGDSYPNPNLAGVGMALKLVCAVEGNSAELLDRYADLVAVGTVADVMPLIDENRYLVRLGLKKLEEAPRPGIAAMMRESSIDPHKLSAATIGFALAPRLNAAGRLGQAQTAARLLMSTNALEASELATELCALNRERQSIEMEIWKDANERLEDTPPNAPIVLASEKWHQGVIGIAASRLAEHYSLPSIMICLNGDVGKGSCRSYGGFNLFEALSACSEHLIGFGGHALAAGLNIRRDKLDDFRAALAEYYKNNRPAAMPEIQCDLLINDPALLSVENVRSLDLLEPYGNANPKPIMCMTGVLLESARNVGNGRHLRMRVRIGSAHFEGIFFSHTMEELNLHEGELIDVAFTPQINDYHEISVQLLVSAARPHDCMPLCRSILDSQPDALYAAARYCPDRADFVRVWRTLGSSFVAGDCAEAVTAQCISGMEAEKFCLCLMVLLETGLLKADGGRIYGAHCCTIDGKADLEATALIRALKAAM